MIQVVLVCGVIGSTSLDVISSYQRDDINLRQREGGDQHVMTALIYTYAHF